MAHTRHNPLATVIILSHPIYVYGIFIPHIVTVSTKLLHKVALLPLHSENIRSRKLWTIWPQYPLWVANGAQSMRKSARVTALARHSRRQSRPAVMQKMVKVSKLARKEAPVGAGAPTGCPTFEQTFGVTNETRSARNPTTRPHSFGRH